MDGEAFGTYFDALYQIMLRTSSSLDLDAVLSYLTEESAQAIHAKASSVRLLNGGRLETRAVYGLSEEYMNKGPVEVPRSEFDRRILEGQPAQMTNVSEEGGFQYPEAARREGIVSVAGVPLVAHGKPIGVLRVYTGEQRTFSEADLHFLQAVADVAALSIENARLYEEMRTNYEETMNTLWGDPLV